jgi:hypothetical protein
VGIIRRDDFFGGDRQYAERIPQEPDIRRRLLWLRMPSERDCFSSHRPFEAQSRKVSHEPIRRVNCTKTHRNIPALSKCPSEINHIDDLFLKQYAKDAWRAASKLDAMIAYWLLFLIFYKFGVVIDDENQQTLNQAFPQLRNYQLVLCHLATLPRPDKPTRKGPADLLFPAKECSALIDSMHSEIRKNAETLYGIGVNSPSFSGRGERVWKTSWPIFTGSVDYTKRPPIIPLNTAVDPVLPELRREAYRFMDQLARSPALALNVPKPASNHSSENGLTLQRPPAALDSVTPASGTAATKKRGRKAPTKEEQQFRQTLADAWERYKETGISKKVFCKDKEITVKRFDRILAVLRKQKRVHATAN